MLLPFHIAIALASLVLTGITLIKPSKNKLLTSYSLVILTLITGTVLVVSKPAHLTQTCAEGLVYLAVVSVGIYVAHHKLAKASA